VVQGYPGGTRLHVPGAAVDEENQNQARQAWTFGLAAILLCVVAPCASQMTLILALPLGWIAFAKARRVLADGPSLDEATEVYARTGQITGLVALAWSVFMLLMLAFVILMYVGMFAMVIALEM
jgi:hypothetical protein